MKATSSPVSDWDVAAAGHWDTAIRGSSALRAAVWRSLLIEAYTLQGLHTCTVLWDLEAFYETIHLSKLVPRCVALGYPEWHLAMGTMAALAPRALLYDKGVGDIIPFASRSLITGDSQSTSYARALLHQVLHDLAHAIPTAPTKQYVDDLSQVVADHDPDVVTHRVVLAGSILHQHTTNLGLTISKKSCLVPNSAVSLSAAASLRALGVPISPAASAEDLGIQCVGGRRRAAAKTAERMHKASLRAIRNGILVRKVGAAARKLTRSGVIPQQSYGFEAHGLSESQIQNMRSNIMRSLGNAPSGSCARTFIAQSNTDILDPAVSYAVAQVGIWIDMWTNASAEHKATIKAAWPRALQMTCKTPPPALDSPR
jgi:hypothetical protein